MDIRLRFNLSLFTPRIEDEKKINHFRVELKDDAIKLFKEYLSKIIL